MVHPALTKRAHRRSPRRLTKLLNLPDDALSLILAHIMSPLALGARPRIVESSYLAGLPLALTCRRLRSLFDASLRHIELWQSGAISARAVSSIAVRTGSGVRSLVLRGCMLIDAAALRTVAAHCPRIGTLDLSHAPLSDACVKCLLPSLPALRDLRLRECTGLTDAAARTIGAHGRIASLDVAGVRALTDVGIAAIARGIGKTLRTLVCSGCVRVSDRGLEALAAHAVALRSLTVRGLTEITNTAIEHLCRARGREMSTLDVLDCGRLHVESYLESVRQHCPKIAWRVGDAQGRSLKQVVISSLAGYIFYVTGSDICNGKAAVYFLLVDAGTSDSFRVSVGSSVCLTLQTLVKLSFVEHFSQV